MAASGQIFTLTIKRDHWGVLIVQQLLMRFVQDETGATAIEYGLIAAGVALAVIGVVSNLGSKLKSTFSSISTQLL
jgi:pilus assembly protein Flp/PilA